MQFALPPRRTPITPPYARSSRISLQRRKQLKAVAILGFSLLTVFFLLSQFFYTSTGTPAVPAGTSSIVVVTVLDRTAWSNEYIQKIVKNREDYAKRHGKATITPVTSLVLSNSKCLTIAIQAIRTSSPTCPTMKASSITPRSPGPSSQPSVTRWPQTLTRSTSST